jgi:hypothetical protein
MVITNRELAAGTTLIAKYRGTQHTVLVLGDHETGLGYELDNGTIYKSPSAAGSAVMNGVACNGWRFWTVAGEEPVTPPANGTKAAKPAKAKKAETSPGGRKFVQVRKMRKQEGCPEGETRWFCSACMSGFNAATGTTPQACPEGHLREVEDELASPEGDRKGASEE